MWWTVLNMKHGSTNNRNKGTRDTAGSRKLLKQQQLPQGDERRHHTSNYVLHERKREKTLLLPHAGWN